MSDRSDRLAALSAASDSSARGETLTEQAKAAGISVATLLRWWKLADQEQESGQDFLSPGKSSGRPPVAKELSEEAKGKLRRSVLKCGSTALAVAHFADDPLCPDALREKILSMASPHSIPLSIRRAAAVTPELKAWYRGPVAYGHVGFKCRHDRRVVDPVTGEERDLLAGDIYISDDMSRNRYFWFPLADCDVETRAGRGDKLAKKFGVALGRQGLFTQDAAGKFLRLDLIGCARDAYNASDVLRHARETLGDWGKPRLGWIMEKGCWSSRAVDGTRMWCGEDEKTALVGGMKSIGVNVEHVHTSEGKALLEGAFHHLQAIQSLYDGVDIGRHRGEMEREKTLINRIQAGTVHPEEAGIEHISEALKNDLKAVGFFNSKPKEGRIQRGVPDEVWARDVGGSPLLKLSRDEAGVFMPTKIETCIRQGCVEKRMGGEIFRFTLPEIFAQLGAGYRVWMAFDPANPAAGAEVYNLETGSKNTLGYGPNAHIGTAEWESARPLYGYSDEVGESADRKKRHHRAVMTAGASTGIYGRRAKTSIEARDGRGNLARVERNAEGGTRNSEGGVRNAERGMGNGERGTRNGELGNRKGVRRIRTWDELAGVGK